MPSSKNYVRDYHHEDMVRKSKEETHRRVLRNKARRDALKAGKVHIGDGKQIDHITPLSKGGSNAKSNQRVVSHTANESFRRNSKGALVSQTSKKEAKNG